ncbi:hypothetical protein JHK82_041143 [Glycine max]|uniref:Uncharacterized protein n=2 Tax=Glycine subgen. Soja TaxID=1462606 RepID=K7M930_SOYBN|nr:hypothetical protein JHK87_041094 [Glycine soja]KAG4947973.1 hypothetical protein JHK86_041212 [Glycine max]KAG4955441.1 hypothetical protein JHK85_041821 [Glycine max]KAG5104173.1 hypothetical protein JHK82_041143 [Glycine max]KAG5115304.1 hypothetical protein JHK84_041417 [Glycine max]
MHCRIFLLPDQFTFCYVEILRPCLLKFYATKEALLTFTVSQLLAFYSIYPLCSSSDLLLVQ